MTTEDTPSLPSILYSSSPAETLRSPDNVCLSRPKGFLKFLNVPVPGVSVVRRVCDSLTFSVRSIVLITPGAGGATPRKGRQVCDNFVPPSS